MSKKLMTADPATTLVALTPEMAAFFTQQHPDKVVFTLHELQEAVECGSKAKSILSRPKRFVLISPI